jgi:hypothetical protein
MPQGVKEAECKLGKANGYNCAPKMAVVCEIGLYHYTYNDLSCKKQSNAGVCSVALSCSSRRSRHQNTFTLTPLGSLEYKRKSWRAITREISQADRGAFC